MLIDIVMKGTRIKMFGLKYASVSFLVCLFSEVNEVLELLSARIQQRIPAAYLANTAVLSEKMFYVDKRVIVPRSYISEVLREGLQPYVEDASEVKSVLDMCTGSGCLVRIRPVIIELILIEHVC